jgi:hypothetical protein
MPKQCICSFCSAPFVTRSDNPGTFCSHACQYALWRSRSEAIFYSHVDKTDDCWLWTGSVRTDGYGQSGVRSRTRPGPYPAHRLAWEFVAGPVPDDTDVLHTCDVRLCVRNDEEGTYEVDGILLPRRGHLFNGTALHNMLDMSAKGRSGRRKLTDTEVLALRAAYAAGRVSQQALAHRFGLDQTTVSDIVRGFRWKYLLP